MKDATNREIGVGDIVEVLANGMLRAVVTKITEPSALAGGSQKAELVVQCGVPFELNPGEEAPVYLIRKGQAPGLREVPKKGRAN